MTWTNKLWKFNTTPDDVNMNALQADITAQTDGDSGAPKNKIASMDTNSIGEDQFVAGSVSQLKLPTASGTAALVFTENNDLTDWTTLPGGEWGFYPDFKVNTSGASVRININYEQLDIPEPSEEIYFNSTTYLTSIGGGSNNNMTLTARQRYIQSSPPYDLGDGLCHRFTFLKIDKTNGDIMSAWTAPDAPWHNNGPTNITSSRWKYILEGGGFDHRQLYADAIHIQKLIAIGGELTDQMLSRLAEWGDVSDVVEQISVVEKIPQSVKNADMNIIPHPFSSSRSNCEIVLLDPMSDLSAQLNELEDDFDEWLAELFMRGFFIISNKELSRVSPPGVKTVSYRWK